MVNIVYKYTSDTPQRFPRAYNSVLKLKDKYNIHFEPETLDDVYSSWKILTKYWGKDDLIIIARSMVINESLLKELVDCPESNCTHYHIASKAYSANKCWSIGARIKDPTLEYCYGVDPKTDPLLPKYVTFAATSFTKIGYKFQIKPLEKYSQMILSKYGKYEMRSGVTGEDTDAINEDNAIIQNVNSWFDGFMKFHIHKEVEHSRTNGEWEPDEELYTRLKAQGSYVE